jgi:iron complex outermembrane receptor protein
MFLFRQRLGNFFVAVMIAMAMPYAEAEQVDLTELSLEQLLEVKVTSASKYEQRASDAPSAVQVITREEIERHGWHTLSEALLTLPGFYISNDQAYDYLGARGFLIPGDYNTRFLLLVDGERNNDNIYQQALPGSEGWVDMSVIERIEYIPGPGSAIYGSNAMFGVINIITRSAGKTPQRKVTAYTSQQGLAGISMLASQTLGGGEGGTGTGVMVQYTNEYKAGRDRTYADPTGMNLTLADGVTQSPDGVAHGLDQARNQRLFLRVDHGEWSMTLLNHERITQPSSALYYTVFDDPALKITDAGTQLGMTLQHKLSDDSSVYARVGYTNWAYRGTYGFLNGLTYYNNYDDVQGETLDGEFRYQVLFGAHHLLTGVELSNDLLARQQNYNSIPLGTPGVDVNTPYQHRAVFVQDEYHMGEDWLMSLGLRSDSSTTSESTNSPRLGLIWHANDAWTAKLLSGRAYRSPNAYESQYGNGFDYLSNPALQAETIQTTEGVLEWQSGKQTRWLLSLYQNKLNNLIQQVDTGSGFQYQNGGWVQVQGVELGVEQGSADELKLRASIAGNQATNDLGTTQGNSPAWVGKASMSMPVFKHSAYFAAEIQIVSSRSYVWNSDTYSVPNEIVGNATLTFPDVLTKGLQAQLRITNLFNSDIQHPASAEMPIPKIPQDGRSLFASISYAF